MFKVIKCWLTQHDLKEPCERRYIDNMFGHITDFKCNCCDKWFRQFIPFQSNEIMDRLANDYLKMRQP